MPPWWRSSSKRAKKVRKKKADLGGIFCLIRRMLKVPSESTPSSSPTRNDIVSEIESKFHTSSPSTLKAQSEKHGEKLQSYPLPPPVNVSATGRVESGKRRSTNIGSSDGSSHFAFPVAIAYQTQNGHNHNNVKGDLVTDSVFSDNGGECDGQFGFRLTNPQECNYQTSTSPKSHVITSQKKMEKRKQDEACVSTQMIATSPKQLPLTPQMANLQIPRYGGLCSAPDSSKSSPFKSPGRVVGPEPSQNDFWAMRPSAEPVFIVPGPSCSPGSRRTPERVSPVSSPGPSPRKQSGPPSADPGFLGPGPSSSPRSGYNSSRRTPECGSPVRSHPSPRIQSGPRSADPGFLVPGPSSSSGSRYNASQSNWTNSRRTPERGSPIPSTRMTSPGPSPRRHIGSPSANWPNDAVNGKQQAYRLPLPPGAVSQTGPSSPVYSPRTTPTVPRSPGRADLVASPGSRWKTGHLLGRGAYGDVYLGFNSDTGEMRAMKEVTLSADDERSMESVQQLEKEIARLRSLRHPNIVQYYGTDTVNDKLYICLEYAGGGSVYKILQEHGAFDECIIRNYTRQILQGLVYLHSKNMIHKDIKGSNILVDTKGHIKLSDFGVAKQISGPSCALPFKGSSHWTAPELIRNSTKSYSFLVDIWSLGCTVQEMATTKPPWSDYNEAVALFKILHTTEIEPPDELSDEGKDFMLQCMQLDPSHRPTAAQLLDHPFVKSNS